MNLFNKINPIAFFISLFIGLFCCYITTPVPTIIFKYPTPLNAGKVIYKDKVDTCYIYKANEVQCPKDKTKIKSHKIEN